MILKNGTNYFDLDLSAQTFQDLNFYHIDGVGAVTAVAPSSAWLATHQVTDVSGALIDFIVARVKEYAIGEITRLGVRYILV